jgi:hypothetical protein
MVAASARQKSQFKTLAEFLVSVASYFPLHYPFDMKHRSQKPVSYIPVRALLRALYLAFDRPGYVHEKPNACLHA